MISISSVNFFYLANIFVSFYRSHKIASRLKLDRKGRSQCGEKIIDCGQNVWGLAIGAPQPENGGRSTVNQSKCVSRISGMVLATGLANGEIKLWEVPSGKMS